MNYFVLDTETTGATNNTYGNPFTQSNKLCYVGCWTNLYHDWMLDVGRNPYGESMAQISGYMDQSELVVGFNIKFDLHWLRRYGSGNIVGKNLWDCQLAYFIMTGQKHPYPSLNDISEYYGLGQKLDIVKTEYWDKGIDTDQIPPEIVKEYLKQDVMLTAQIFEKQREELKNNPQLKKLIWYNCQDLAVTAEMEWSGIKYDMIKSTQIGDQLQLKIQEIDKELHRLINEK